MCVTSLSCCSADAYERPDDQENGQRFHCALLSRSEDLLFSWDVIWHEESTSNPWQLALAKLGGRLFGSAPLLAKWSPQKEKGTGFPSSTFFFHLCFAPARVPT